MNRKPPRAALGIALTMLIVRLSACGGDGPPNLILITVDTLRHDRLGHTGHPRPTSPWVDSLAARGVVFEVATSASGWTLPSMATVLTGLPPSEHGATYYDSSVPRILPNLASILRDAGYDTRGFVSHVMLQERTGMNNGFETFDATVLRVGNPHRVSSAVPLTNLVLRNLASNRPTRPLFLWVHYFDPHAVYMTQPDVAFGASELDLYDGEIRHTDNQIARLMENLDLAGLTQHAVIVFTADHGEEFGDHGGKYHDSLHAEVLRVPLVIAAPGLDPGRRRDPASQIDLLPTLLALLDQPIAGDLPGVDLFASPDPKRPIYAERDIPNGFAQRSVRLGRHKLIEVRRVPKVPGQIVSQPAEPSVREGLWLYDVEIDPAEQSPLPVEGEVGRELISLLRDRFGS